MRKIIVFAITMLLFFQPVAGSTLILYMQDDYLSDGVSTYQLANEYKKLHDGILYEVKGLDGAINEIERTSPNTIVLISSVSRINLSLIDSIKLASEGVSPFGVIIGKDSQDIRSQFATSSIFSSNRKMTFLYDPSQYNQSLGLEYSAFTGDYLTRHFQGWNLTSLSKSSASIHNFLENMRDSGFIWASTHGSASSLLLYDDVVSGTSLVAYNGSLYIVDQYGNKESLNVDISLPRSLYFFDTCYVGYIEGVDEFDLPLTYHHSLPYALIREGATGVISNLYTQSTLFDNVKIVLPTLLSGYSVGDSVFILNNVYSWMYDEVEYDDIFSKTALESMIGSPVYYGDPLLKLTDKNENNFYSYNITRSDGSININILSNESASLYNSQGLLQPSISSPWVRGVANEYAIIMEDYIVSALPIDLPQDAYDIQLPDDARLVGKWLLWRYKPDNKPINKTITISFMRDPGSDVLISKISGKAYVSVSSPLKVVVDNRGTRKASDVVVNIKAVNGNKTFKINTTIKSIDPGESATIYPEISIGESMYRSLQGKVKIIADVSTPGHELNLENNHYVGELDSEIVDLSVLDLKKDKNIFEYAIYNHADIPVKARIFFTMKKEPFSEDSSRCVVIPPKTLTSFKEQIPVGLRGSTMITVNVVPEGNIFEANERNNVLTRNIQL